VTEYISICEALKLITPFKGEIREVISFIAKVNTAFEVTDPRNATILYRFVLTIISGETRTAIHHRNLGRIKRILKEHIF
jgi:hypothetical protein